MLDHSGRPRRPDSPSSIYSRPFDSASIFPRAPSHSPDYCGTPQPEPWPESPHYYSTASPDPRSQSPDNRETQYSESGSGSPVDCGAEPSAESPAATNPLTTEEHQVCYTSFPSFEEQQPQPEEEETQIEEEKPQIEKEEPQIVPEGISTLKDLADLSDSLAKLIEHRQKSEAPKATPAYKKLSGASFLPAAFEEATGLSVEEFISSPVTAREIKKYRREVNRLYSTDCEVDRTITLLQGLQEHHATDRSSSLLSDDDSLFDDFDPSLLPLPLKIRRHRQGHQTRYSTQRCAPRIKPKLDELIGPIEGSSPSDPFGPSPSRHGSFSPNSQISLGIGEFLRTTEPPPPIVLNAGSSIDRSESRSSFRSSSLLARAARSFSSGSWKKFVRKGSKAKLTPLPEESNLSSLARSSNSTTLVRNSQNSQNSQDDGSLIRFDSSTLTSRSPPAHPSLSILEEKTEPSSSDEPLSLHPRRLRAASNLPGTPRQLFEDSYPMTLSRTRNAKKRISSVLDEDIEPTEVANEDPDLSDDDAWLSDPVLDPPVQFSGGAFQRPVSSLVASVCNYDGADDAEEQTDDWQDIPDHIDGEFNGPEQIQTHGEDSDIQTVTNTRKRKVKPSKKALTARNEDDDDDGAYKASKPTKAKAKKNTRPAKRRRDLYNDEGTLFSAKSKLLNGDLRVSLFLRPITFSNST